MIGKYIKVSFRRILRQKSISFINILGLAIGFSLSFVVLLYLLNETGYDKQHLKRNQIFRLIQNYHPEASDPNYKTTVFDEYFSIIRSDYPEIVKSTGLYKIFGDLKLINNDISFSNFDLVFADKEVNDIFTLPLVKGNKNELLENPFDIVITESKARVFFGEQNPIDKTLLLFTESDTILLTVKGIISDFSINSTFKPDIICKYNSEYKWKDDVFLEEVYLLLANETNYKELEKKLPVEKVDYGAIMITEFMLQPFNEIYFKSDFINYYSKAKGNLLNVIILSIIGIVILVVSINNFIIFFIFDGQYIIKDLATRKVVGASIKNLRIQYFTNAFLYTILGFFVSVILTWLIIPSFNQLFATDLFKTLHENLFYIFPMFLILILSGIISGSYLAIYISSQNPLQLFQSSFATIKAKNRFQKGIVLFQLFLFISLTAFSILVNSQINFALEKESGYKKSGLLFVTMDKSETCGLIKQEIAKLPNVESVTSIYFDIPVKDFRKMHLPKYNSPLENVVLDVLYVDNNFFKTMEIPFLNKYVKDTILNKRSYVINKAAALKLNIDLKSSNIDLIDKSGTTYKISNICENFDFQGIQNEVTPLAIVMRDIPMNYLVVRAKNDNSKNSIEKLIHELYPNIIFSISNFNSQMSKAYTKETRFLRTISLGNIIVILITTLGLFNVVILTLKRRTKEIAIRKVLGAKEQSIYKLLFKEFSSLLIISNIFAIPIAIWGMNVWLQNFAYQVNINSLIFLFTAFLSVIIILTISFISIKILMSKNLTVFLNAE